MRIWLVTERGVCAFGHALPRRIRIHLVTQRGKCAFATEGPEAHDARGGHGIHEARGHTRAAQAWLAGDRPHGLGGRDRPLDGACARSAPAPSSPSLLTPSTWQAITPSLIRSSSP